jgi:hypothetical protein
MLDKIKKRITALLSKTVANGCTEDEAHAAMMCAAGLMAQHGIDADAVRPAGTRATIKEKANYSLMKPYEALCAEAAALLYGVECHAPNFGKHGFHYVGREENVEAAEELYMWLVQQIESLYKQALPKGLSVKARSEFRTTFKGACGERIKERAQQVRRDMVRDERVAQQITSHNALVVQGHFQTLYQEIRDHYSDIDKRREAERQLRDKERLEYRQQKLAAMSEEERVELLAAEDLDRQRREKQVAQDLKRWERNWSRRNPDAQPRQRSIKRGSGTDAGRRAGDQVKLSKELPSK